MYDAKIAGCLFGSAFGDALAADTEFLSVKKILSRYPNGPQDLQGFPALVTDDTQMALAVGKALMEAEQPYTAITLEGPLRRAFVEWSESPDNDRSPGVTCMNACAMLASGMPWQQATVINSKGCGANMRVAPVGLLRGIPQATRAAIAQFQAALTHGHPTGLAASDLTAFAIVDLVAGNDLAGLTKRLREYALSQRRIYHEEWLGSLWQYFDAVSPEDFISQGWNESLQALDRLDSALQTMDRESDPCLATGAGWIAEEALATGLYCFMMFPDDPIAAIGRAAVTSGDSDSIACLAGAFAGSHLGLSAWPARWIEQIEYRNQIDALCNWLVTENEVEQ